MRTLIAALSVAAAVLATACVDTTPFVVEEAVRDASAGPSADSAVGQSCRACLVGDGAPCRAAYDACHAIPNCDAFTECVFPRGCFSLALLEERIVCGQPCIELIGLTSSSPELNPILEMNKCTQDLCRSACIVE